MHNLRQAHGLVADAKRYRAEEKKVYDQFIQSARRHRLSITIGTTVLYVEDNPDSVSVFKALIEVTCNNEHCEKINVKPISGASEAKAFIENNFMMLKCVVLDLNLAEGDGEALLDWISHKYGESLPVIVYSNDITRVEEIREKHPMIEILIKGAASSVELANAVRLHRSCRHNSTIDCELFDNCTDCPNYVGEEE